MLAPSLEVLAKVVSLHSNFTGRAAMLSQGLVSKATFVELIWSCTLRMLVSAETMLPGAPTVRRFGCSLKKSRYRM